MSGPQQFQALRFPATSADLALACCAGTGWLASPLVLLSDLKPDTGLPASLVLLLGAIFAPLLVASVSARLPQGRHIWLIRGALQALQLSPLLAVPQSPLRIGLGLALLAQGNLLLRSAQRPARVLTILSGPLQVVVGLQIAPTPILLALLPLALVPAVAAAHSLQQADGISMLGRGRARFRLASAQPPPRRCLQEVLFLSATILSLALLLLALLPQASETGLGQSPSDERAADLAERAGASEGSWESEPGSTGFLPQLEYSPPFTHQNSVLGRAIVLRVWNASTHFQRPAQSPFLLREIVLDDFQNEEIRLSDRSAPPLIRDGDDGELNGWCMLTEGPHMRERIHLQVECAPRHIEPQGWTVLFTVEPLYAIWLPELLHSPDSVSVLPELRTENVRYALSTIAPGSRGMPSDVRAWHADPQTRALPELSPALLEIQRIAAEWTAGARDDETRIARVMERFREEFRYSLEDRGLRGPPAIADFLRSKRGFCTYFAAATVLILRSLDISARVAVGMKVSEWEPNEKCWVARERDAHAWVEVFWPEIGWLSLDPTPPDERERAFASLDAEERARNGGYFARLAADFQLWVNSAGQDLPLRGLVLRLLEGVWLSARFVLPALLILVALRRWQRARRSPTAPYESSERPAAHRNSLLERLLCWLRASGVARTKDATLREYTLNVLGPSYLPPSDLGQVLASVEKAQFGPRELTAEEVDEAEAAWRTLEARQVPGAARPGEIA